MQLVPSTALALIAIAVLVLRGPQRGLWAFLALAPFGAAAAFNLPALGGASIGLKELAVPALFLLVLLVPGGPDRMVGTLRPGRPGFWLLLLLAYCLLSAIFAPAVFRGATEVFSISRIDNALGIVSHPLRPSTGNVTQLFIFTLSALAFAALATAFRQRPDAGAVVGAMAVTTAVNFALGWIDVLGASIGASWLLDPVRTANYAILDTHYMMGLKRMIGGFPEASSFGAFSLGLFAFWLQYWSGARKSVLGRLMLVAAAISLLRSTSSGAYVSLVAYLVLWGGFRATTGVRSRVARHQAGLTLAGVLVFALAALALVGAYLLVDPVSAFVDRSLLDKLDTRSGVERMSWNRQAFQNFTDTWGIGAGLGSVRGSSWLFSSLGSIGLIGTVLFLWFLVSVLLVPAPGTSPGARVVRALKSALFALFVSEALTGSTPNLGVFYLALAGLAAGLSRGARQSAEAQQAQGMAAQNNGQAARGMRRDRQQAAPGHPIVDGPPWRRATGCGFAEPRVKSSIGACFQAPIGPAPNRGGPRAMISRATFALMLALMPCGAVAQELPTAPRLGAATNFGQGWKPGVLSASRQLGVLDFRDAVYWRQVERNGRYVFEGERSTYPDLLERMGAGMSLTVNNGHPDYDAGKTPLSTAAVEAFASHAAAAVTRFPAIDAVEVGNEMNSERFVSGPGWDDAFPVRARSYAALLAATARAVRAARPGVRILGGAAHSIPLAWFRALSEAGAPGHMDAVVIHPYTVPPEDLRREIALLRTVPGFEAMPVEVTEFGHPNPDIAPAHLLKSYCQMALSGVTRAVWYPLGARGDGLSPLVGADGAPTPVGRTYAMIGAELEGRRVADAAPDPFTYACRFGEDRLVIWGEPRNLMLAGRGLIAVDPQGRRLAGPEIRLSMERPVLIRSAGAPLLLGDNLLLEDQRLIAHSRHQFTFPGGGRAGPFEYLARRGDREEAMQTRPGQEKGGVPWTPYLGSSMDGMLRAGPRWVLPAGGGDRGLDVVLRYRVPAAMTVELEATVDPADRSVDGVVFALHLDGREMDRRTVTERTVLGYPAMLLEEGEVLEFSVGPGQTSRGDVTGLQVALRRPAR